VADSAAPRDLASWRRPTADGIHVEHPLFARIPVLGAHLPLNILGPGVLLLDGGAWTVKAIGHHYGPSERITMSPGDWDGSTMNLVTGQSGQPLSPHYMDQWPAWRDGTTFAWPFSDAAVDRAKVHELVLQPK
jgi:penicillin G amidase